MAMYRGYCTLEIYAAILAEIYSQSPLQMQFDHIARGNEIRMFHLKNNHPKSDEHEAVKPLKPILIFVFAVYLLCFCWSLVARQDDFEIANDLVSKIFSSVSTLAGTVVGYYFGKSPR